MKIKVLILFLVLGSTELLSQNNESEDQKSSTGIATISAKAYECIEGIDVNISKKEKSEEISACINSAILFYKTKESLTVNDEIKAIQQGGSEDSIDGKNDVDVILDGAHYDEVEDFLYDHCTEMGKIYFINNQEHQFSYSKNKKAIEWYKKGEDAFRNENYEKAIEYFDKAIQVDKKFAFAWDNLGYSYRKLGEYKKAIKCYKKSLKLDPHGKMPLMNIAVAYKLDKNYKKAQKAYTNFKNIYKDDPEGYYGLGSVYYLQKRYTPALENMIQAYILYSKMNSPYRLDAGTYISNIYKKMKEQRQLKEFRRIAKKYDVHINE